MFKPKKGERIAERKAKKKPTSQSSDDKSESWESESSSSSSHTPPPSPKHSRAYTVIDDETNDILRMLRQSVDMEEWELKEENKYDNLAVPHRHLENLFKRDKQEEDKEELASNSDDRKDEIRLALLYETRPRWLTIFLKVAFHVCVIVNFFLSWYDSVRLLLESAKMDFWLLEDEYNCLEIVPNVDWLDHTMNILHALLSCSVLYVYNRRSATLCLAWICSQAAHLIFKTFQHFYNLKFEKSVYSHGRGAGLWTLAGIIALDGFSALVLLHKYYDLTDRFKARAKYLGTTDASERSLNDKIIYKNDSPFLQRKSILREVTTTQTCAIVKKIGKHVKQGIRVDPVSLDREINAAKLALADCATVQNQNMFSVLRQAYAQRLKQLENEQMAKGIAVANTHLAQSNIIF